jgi:hypothetical protein
MQSIRFRASILRRFSNSGRRNCSVTCDHEGLDGIIRRYGGATHSSGIGLCRRQPRVRICRFRHRVWRAVAGAGRFYLRRQRFPAWAVFRGARFHRSQSGLARLSALISSSCVLPLPTGLASARSISSASAGVPAKSQECISNSCRRTKGPSYCAGRAARLRRGASRNHERGQRAGQGGTDRFVSGLDTAGAGRWSIRLLHRRALADLARRATAAASRTAGAVLIQALRSSPPQHAGACRATATAATCARAICNNLPVL